MYACIYVCMYVCTYMHMYVCIYVSIYICMYVCIHVCMYVCMYVCMNVCASTRAPQPRPAPSHKLKRMHSNPIAWFIHPVFDAATHKQRGRRGIRTSGGAAHRHLGACCAWHPNCRDYGLVQSHCSSRPTARHSPCQQALRSSMCVCMSAPIHPMM